MKILLGNIWAQTPPGPIRSKAWHILSYRPQGYRFTTAYIAGRWDGFVRMVNKAGFYPAGLTPLLIERLEAEGLEVSVTDERTKPSLHPAISAAKVLFPLNRHQQDAVAVAQRTARGVVEHPTGSGKGRVIAATVARLGVSCLVLVHRKVLLKQLYDELRNTLDIPALVGVVGAGRDEPGPITVSTFQTMASRLKNYPDPAAEMLAKFSAVLVDETHHIGGAKTYEVVMKSLTHAYYRIGFSATAHRSDDETTMRVTGWLGPIQAKMTTTEAIAEQRVVPADVYMVEPGEPHPDGAGWQEAYDYGVVGHERRNQIIVALAVRLKGLSMILVERVNHGKRLAAMLSQLTSTPSYAFLDGSDSEGRRETVLDMARDGMLKILIGTEILGEGVNVPAVRNLIVARAGRASHRTIQAVGRGTRAHEGKDRVIVIDFSDTDTVYTKKTGKPREGPLTTQARARRKTYESEEAYSVCDIGYEELMKWLT